MARMGDEGKAVGCVPPIEGSRALLASLFLLCDVRAAKAINT
jgi:hypothetical protein